MQTNLQFSSFLEFILTCLHHITDRHSALKNFEQLWLEIIWDCLCKQHVWKLSLCFNNVKRNCFWTNGNDGEWVCHSLLVLPKPYVWRNDCRDMLKASTLFISSSKPQKIGLKRCSFKLIAPSHIFWGVTGIEIQSGDFSLIEYDT